MVLVLLWAPDRTFETDICNNDDEYGNYDNVDSIVIVIVATIIIIIIDIIITITISQV